MAASEPPYDAESRRSRPPEPEQLIKLGDPAVEMADKPAIGTPATNSGVARRVWSPEPVRGCGDSELARLAAAQRGVVTRAQAKAAGLGRHAIDHRLRTGRLHQLHRGIYLVGRPSLEPLAAETAAVLSFDGHAVLSHASAAALWGLVDAPPSAVTVTLVAHHGHACPGVRIHRTLDLDARDLRLCHGLPVTAPARTIVDFAAGSPSAELEQAVSEARVQRLLRPGELEAVLARTPHRRGSARVRALLTAEHDPAFTRRESERRMLALVRSAQLPSPVVNGRVLGFEVDFHWPAQRLVIETDGHQFHGHRAAFENDRRRDQILVAAGWRVMRVTWRQLTTEPLAVVARLAMAIALAPRAA